MITTLTTRFWQTSLTYWRASSRLQRVLFVSGTGLFIAMLAHGVALVATGGSIHGPVSFRKAMTFAETGWLLCWAVGWLLPLIRMRRWERGFVAFGALLFGIGETILMSTQVWRGVPSHYNTTTPFDNLVFRGTGIIAITFTASMLVLLVAALRERRLASSLLLSIRAGVVLLLYGLLIGFIMIMNSSGVWQGTAHLLDVSFEFRLGTHETGGDLVLLHAIGVHGLNLVPLVAWLLTYSHLPERARTIISAFVAANIALTTAVISVHVFSALSLDALDLITLTVLAICGTALLAAYAAAAWWALRGILPPTRPAYEAH